MFHTCTVLDNGAYNIQYHKIVIENVLTKDKCRA